MGENVVPDKPSLPLSIGVFPKAGGFETTSEQLPKSKVEAELRIAANFASALKVRFGRELGKLTPSEWPDVVTSEGERRVGIELVEIVNPAHVKNGGYGKPQWVDEDIPHRLLLQTIREKVRKNYARPNDMDVWLLAYDLTCAVGFEHVLAKRMAHAWLCNQNHGFSEIWFMFPTPAAGSFPSVLESVWPTTEHTSTDGG
ncbi:hypothetical protein [Massilia sp. TS11]|uniref:hypothetical protein n=1 Tax=Massilia sp. TS11 TaxID=2908003 RepID=UPI001ED9FC52|nr:hypothetical protein [Massilia sp. TS11]MCG2583064.1 hypothetical protein [Massilia sp. TS11]